MITGFNHTSFTVANLDAAVRFWTETLGFEAASVSERTGDWQGRITGVPNARLKVAHLYGYGHHMEFIQYLDAQGPTPDLQPNMPGMAHICLEVRDIEATVRLFKDHGGRAQGEIVDISSGPLTSVRAAYMRDPDNILIELLELPAERNNTS